MCEAPVTAVACSQESSKKAGRDEEQVKHSIAGVQGKIEEVAADVRQHDQDIQQLQEQRDKVSSASLVMGATRSVLLPRLWV